MIVEWEWLRYSCCVPSGMRRTLSDVTESDVTESDVTESDVTEKAEAVGSGPAGLQPIGELRQRPLVVNHTQLPDVATHLGVGLVGLTHIRVWWREGGRREREGWKEGGRETKGGK